MYVSFLRTGKKVKQKQRTPNLIFPLIAAKSRNRAKPSKIAVAITDTLLSSILFRISLKKGLAGAPLITIRLQSKMWKNQSTEIMARNMPNISLRQQSRGSTFFIFLCFQSSSKSDSIKKTSVSNLRYWARKARLALRPETNDKDSLLTATSSFEFFFFILQLIASGDELVCFFRQLFLDFFVLLDSHSSWPVFKLKDIIQRQSRKPDASKENKEEPAHKASKRHYIERKGNWHL